MDKTPVMALLAELKIAAAERNVAAARTTSAIRTDARIRATIDLTGSRQVHVGLRRGCIG